MTYSIKTVPRGMDDYRQSAVVIVFHDGEIHNFYAESMKKALQLAVAFIMEKQRQAGEL